MNGFVTAQSAASNRMMITRMRIAMSKTETTELTDLYLKALTKIRDTEPSEIAPDTFPGLVHGPALLLSNCQRVAREALKGKFYE
jgi:hypothetical protein